MKNNDIQDLLRKVVNPLQLNESKICVVREEVSNDWSINVEPITSPNFDLENPVKDNYIYGVKLAANRAKVVGSDIEPIYLNIPTIGSYVVISPIENNGWFLSLTTEIKEIYLINNTQTGISIFENFLYMNADTFGVSTKTEAEEGSSIGYDPVDGINIISYSDVTINSKTQLNLFSNGGKITIKNASKSIKKDVFDKIQSILTSLDAGLTGLGGVDPTRTADIAALIPTLAALLKD